MILYFQFAPKFKNFKNKLSPFTSTNYHTILHYFHKNVLKVNFFYFNCMIND